MKSTTLSSNLLLYTNDEIVALSRFGIDTTILSFLITVILALSAFSLSITETIKLNLLPERSETIISNTPSGSKIPSGLAPENLSLIDANSCRTLSPVVILITVTFAY